MSSEEKDSKAKEAARSPASRASKPGAAPVQARAEQAATLDQRIAEKQQKLHTKNGSVAASPGARQHLEDVVSAKQRGSLVGGATCPSKPGAYHERAAPSSSLSNPSILAHLEAFEGEVEAKNRAAVPGATSVRYPSGVQGPESSKIRREPAGDAAAWNDEKAVADLSRLENSVMSKVRTVPAATKPGAVAVAAEGDNAGSVKVEKTENGGPTWDSTKAMGDLVRLEDSATSKVRGHPLTSKPGAVSVSNGGDVSASAKVQKSEAGGSTWDDDKALTDLARLEESAVSKARGAPAALKPGAVPVTTGVDSAASVKVQRESSNAMPPGVRAHFHCLEDEASSKIRRQSPDTTAGAQALLQTMEDSIGAKIRRDGGSTAGSNAGYGAFSDMKMAEDSVAAKIRGVPVAVAASPSGLAGASGHAQADLTSLQESVFYKVRAGQSARAHPNGRAGMALTDAAATSTALSASSGAPADLGQMQNSLLNKFGDQGTTKNADQELSQLGELVRTKDFLLHNGADPSVAGTTDDANDKNDKEGERAEAAPPEIVTRFADGAPASTDVENGGVSSGGVGLAVAVAVEEEDDDLFIPSAVQYDPDAKPPMYKNRRFRLYGFLAFFIIVVVAIGASIASTLGKELSTPAPTQAPTTTREGLGIRDAVERVVGSELLDDPDSPYSTALDWITFDDPQQLSPKADNFIQRYIAAYVYFATSVDGPWRSCGPPKNAHTDSGACSHKVLASIFPEVVDSKPSFAWLSKADECDWAGIICDDQFQVRTVDLSGGLLTGSFPEGVVHFLYLQELSLYWNNLTGTLPPHVVDMEHLISIELHFNKFTGSIPNEWWSAKNLQRVNVGENLITGTISSDVANLRDMKGFFVMTNLLTGTLPEELGVMDSVTYFRFSRNSFSGSIPQSFTNLKNANEGWFHRNQLNGTIPEDIGSLELLADLRLHVNPMTGSIPESLWDLDQLWRLDLYECNFTGTLSEAIGKLGRGFFELHLNNNLFEGPLPQNLTQLVDMYDLWIQNNDFTGTVPQALCDIKGDSEFGALSVFQADCAADSSGNIELSCPQSCCSTCCKGDGTDCLSLGSGG